MEIWQKTLLYLNEMEKLKWIRNEKMWLRLMKTDFFNRQESPKIKNLVDMGVCGHTVFGVTSRWGPLFFVYPRSFSKLCKVHVDQRKQIHSLTDSHFTFLIYNFFFSLFLWLYVMTFIFLLSCFDAIQLLLPFSASALIDHFSLLPLDFDLSLSSILPPLPTSELQ